MEIREASALRQQRRIKQAIQFLHKDSADLLPLDGLNKLGTSKEWQPHNILQRRLLEANMSRSKINNNHGMKQHQINPCRTLCTRREEDDNDLIQVVGKCCGRELVILVDTGCAVNLISTVSVEKLGLKEKVASCRTEEDSYSTLVDNLQTPGHVDLNLSFGQVRTDCTFMVVGNEQPLVALGTRTLRSLKCVIDTDKQTLTLGKGTRAQLRFSNCKGTPLVGRLRAQSPLLEQ
ncbi:nuclear receptor-interacting protein 3-like [Sardina pilchardus]|uniref:nuclear receptor-interacting protein 3-like n=1 Tax=Sardina pilchardus TaxID=27697 RepID=UPI002E131F7A